MNPAQEANVLMFSGHLSPNTDFQMTFLGILLLPERSQKEIFIIFYYGIIFIVFSLISLIYHWFLILLCIFLFFFYFIESIL